MFLSFCELSECWLPSAGRLGVGLFKTGETAAYGLCSICPHEPAVSSFVLLEESP